MANNLNLCQFIGNLGNDPDQRFMPSGQAVTAISIACNWKTKDKEGTEWIRVVAFDKLAEIMGQYLKKGSKVYIAGRMRTRSYEKDGVTVYATEIIADRMEMLDTRGGSQGDGHDDDRQPAAPSRPTQGTASRPANHNRPADFDNFDDDIPF